MKKILLLAAALLAFAGCKEKETQPEETPKPDEISVSPEERTVGGEGGEVSVTVTSTGNWTLAAKSDAQYDWVSADKTSGANGDKVTFTVEPNTDAEKTAEFTFSCGKAQAAFKLTSTPQEVVIPTIEVTSGNTVEVGYAEGSFQVTLNVSETVDATALEAVTDGDWVTFENAAAGSTAGTAVMNFTYTANEESNAREATITISYPNADAQTVTVNQAGAPATTIELTSPENVDIEAEAGTLEVTFNISNNVNFLNIVGSSDQTWMTFKGTSQKTPGTVAVTFEYQANTDASARSASITVSYEDKDYATVSVNQKGSAQQGGGDYLITTAPYMKYHCAGVDTWKTPEAVNNLGKTLTVEMLVRHDETFVTSGSGYETGYQWSGDWVGTLFGLEGRFLIRHGDNTENYKQWELVCGLTPSGEFKLRSSKDLPGGEWVHIAVVLDGTTATLYQDGENVGSSELESNIYDVDLTSEFQGYEQPQAFHVGRSYNNARDFCGNMSEVRVWNRALTQDEIKAKDHFYTVDPASEGLVAYWKMNEGTGTTFKDYTTNGNDMTCYVLDLNYANAYKAPEAWSVSAEWHDVQLGPIGQ